MRLVDGDGLGLDLGVTGYQFPDAADPGKRFSWHMVEGAAFAPTGRWQFRYPALTCDETPRVSAWLRDAAIGGGQPGLAFTEPNLAFRVVGRSSGQVTLNIELDLEFSPPWERRRSAGDPFILAVSIPRQGLIVAADAWDQETAPFPDGLAP
ncbi:hypothetical protein AB0L64_01795 [Kribbella sp. NPDC051936]|uniref:WapI family immunity protein n=1 Tax=Kribbella sp. NPDC051936 TaxID=3154946 RepID=UPI00343A5DB3